jgi:hypothetical protein
VNSDLPGTATKSRPGREDQYRPGGGKQKSSGKRNQKNKTAQIYELVKNEPKSTTTKQNDFFIGIKNCLQL